MHFTSLIPALSLHSRQTYESKRVGHLDRQFLISFYYKRRQCSYDEGVEVGAGLDPDVPHEVYATTGEVVELLHQVAVQIPDQTKI